MNKLKLDLSLYNLDGPEYDRFINLVIKNIAFPNSLTYAFSAYHAALAFELSKAKPVTNYNTNLFAELAVKLNADYLAKHDEYMEKFKRGYIARDTYLHSGGDGHTMLAVLSWCADFVPAEMKEKCVNIISQTAWNLENYTKSNWGGEPDNFGDGAPDGYSGWAHNLPGNNYFFSHIKLLECFYVLTGNRTYLDKRLALLEAYWSKHEGGGSREGTGYGAALMSLFSFAMSWREQTGETLSAVTKHAEGHAPYLVNATTPMMNETAPIGDQSRVSRKWAYDGDLANFLILRATVTDETVRALCTWWMQNFSLKTMARSEFYHLDILHHGTIAIPPAKLSHHSPGAGHYFWRSSLDKDATYIVLAAGPNDESHDHHDQGSIYWFYKDWLTCTHNYLTHSGIRQNPDVQNVLNFKVAGSTLINQSRAGLCKFALIEDGHVISDLDNAHGTMYGIKWKREFNWSRTTLRINDTYSANTGITATFQLNTGLVVPVVTGNKIAVGPVVYTVESPVNPIIKVVDWKVIDPADSLQGGYKFTVDGGQGEYIVSGILDLTAVPVPVEPPPPPGLTPITGPIWFDGSLPTGAKPTAHGEQWVWSDKDKTPQGTRTHVTLYSTGQRQHFFEGATLVMPVVAGDKLAAMLYIDPTNKPSQIMLQWNDGTWEHRAYWGANLIAWGTDSTVSRRRIGDIPEAGKWITLEVPVADVGLAGRTIRGMAFTAYGGKITWGAAGKAPLFPTVEPEEDPEMTKALQAQVAELTAANQKLTNQLSASQQELASARDVIVVKTSEIAELETENEDLSKSLEERAAELVSAQQEVAQKTATLESQAPMIAERDKLVGIMQEINRYAPN